MAERLLQLDELRTLTNPEQIAKLFTKLGYEATPQPVNVEDLQLSSRCGEAVDNAYLIADKGNGGLQVLLFQLKPGEWSSSTVASARMKAIASSIGRRSTKFLLLATKDYDQLMLVNPRLSFDGTNFNASIRKLLIDRTNPTAYDRDRLEAIADEGQLPEDLYKIHCEAFDVEKLTKSFYKGYKILFDKVKAVVQQFNQSPYFQDIVTLHQFSQRLLGRLMFLYFLQKKEFLGGDRKFLTNQYKRLKTDHDNTDYYASVLEPLFFETLNRQRSNLESPWGKIPYLNGGLFDRDYGLGIKDVAGRLTPEKIELPNSLFDPGDNESILGFLNSYNFTIAENISGDEDVAVDPEMLGKVFENMLAASERGQSGTFYTPRSIVSFMCIEVLARYLSDESGMTLEFVRKIIDFDPDLPEAELNQLMNSQQARTLKKALQNIKVLDPAVGSGAFPLGMMQAILSTKIAIAQREGMTVQRGSLTISQWKREIIGNNLYGVDIKPEAIEIAKLRMWLSMVVDVPSIEDIEPLPNLDYKLMCGDSLISTIDGEQLIPDPTKTVQTMLAVTPVQQAIQPILELQQQYFDAISEERQQLRFSILEAEKNVFRLAVADRRKYWELQRDELTRKIASLNGKITPQVQKKQKEIAQKLAELDKFALSVETGERSVNFFQYHLHFRDVFESQGGFDVVIGNPPYVRQEQIKELKSALQQEYDCYTGVADLYVYFFEKGFRLLKDGGHLSYISSNKYFRAGYGEKLRKFLGENATVEQIIDFGDAPVFEAIAYPSIILVSKATPTNHQALVLNWEVGQSLDEFATVFKTRSFLIAQKELTAEGWRLESATVLRLLDKLRAAGTPLGEYVNGRFYRGILTGLNEAFIVNRETRDRLVAQHPSSAEVLKPFVRGRDVKRWCVDFAEQYLIKIESSENKTHPWSGKPPEEASKIFAATYPAIHARFDEFREKLINRSDQGKYFWELRSCTYWNEFSQQKIVYPNICKRNDFTFDTKDFLFNQKAFIIPTTTKEFLGILNSSCVTWLFYQLLAKLQNDFYEPSAIFMKNLPIPVTKQNEAEQIASLVQKCLDAKGKSVEKWEAEIDDRVAHLYGLTKEEIKIIRGE